MRVFLLAILAFCLIIIGGYFGDTNHWAIAISFWLCGIVSLIVFFGELMSEGLP